LRTADRSNAAGRPLVPAARIGRSSRRARASPGCNGGAERRTARALQIGYGPGARIRRVSSNGPSRERGGSRPRPRPIAPTQQSAVELSRPAVRPDSGRAHLRRWGCGGTMPSGAWEPPRSLKRKSGSILRRGNHTSNADEMPATRSRNPWPSLTDEQRSALRVLARWRDFRSPWITPRGPAAGASRCPGCASPRQVGMRSALNLEIFR
jgi:hypothetical protein